MLLSTSHNTPHQYLPLLVLLMGIFIGTNAGCDQAENTDDQTNATGKKITYWSAPNPQEYKLAKTLVRQWNKNHPEIQVKLQALPAGQSSEEVLLSAMVAGTTPDVCSNIWPGVVNDFVRANGLQALDTLEGFKEIVKKRIPQHALKNARSANGHIYQIPWKTNPIMMQYNVGMFEKAGIHQVPETYTEFLAAAEKVTRDKDGDGDIDQWMGYRDIRPIWWQRYYDYYTSYIAASGGQTFFKDGSLNIDEEVSTQVFRFFRTIYEQGYFPRSTLQGNAFLYSKIAVQFTGPWNIAYLENNAPDSLTYDFAPIPVPDNYQGKTYTYGDHKNIAIFSTTEHPEAAWKFVKFLITKKADLKLLSFAKQIPIRKNLLSDPMFRPFFKDHPMLAEFAKQAAYTRSVDDVRDFKEILDTVSRFFERSSVYRKLPPEQATREMIEAIKVIRDWYK